MFLGMNSGINGVALGTFIPGYKKEEMESKKGMLDIAYTDRCALSQIGV